MLFGFDLPFPKSSPAHCVFPQYTKRTFNKQQGEQKNKIKPKSIGAGQVARSSLQKKNPAHTHSLMVEKPLSSSCIRSITAVSLKPPPEPFSATAPCRHRAVRRYRPSKNFSAEWQRRRVLSLPGSPLPSSSLSGRRKNVGLSNSLIANGGLTHRHFRRSALAIGRDWLILGWEGPLIAEVLFSPPAVFCFTHLCLYSSLTPRAILVFRWII